MELKEAVTAFLKARNALTRTLLDVVDTGEKLIFKHKTHDHHIVISEKLSVVNVSEKTTVACLNTKENVNFLVDNWEEFLVPKLSILFVNPNTQEQWKVMPVAHNAVAERKKLKKGLEALFSQVTEV
jgi:hypothetical protein